LSKKIRVNPAPSGKNRSGLDGSPNLLTNLVANALRHTPPGGQVTLRAHPVPDHVRITVSDTGEGIPAEDLAARLLALVQGLAMRWSLENRRFDLEKEGVRLLGQLLNAP